MQPRLYDLMQAVREMLLYQSGDFKAVLDGGSSASDFYWESWAVACLVPVKMQFINNFSRLLVLQLFSSFDVLDKVLV